jgi:outer membrane protein assembly factor BamB/serine/threonine protein kinase
MPDRVGQQLGNYRLLRLLGRGGFAEVYLGEHVYLKRPAALKVLHRSLEEEDVERFLAESQVLARLDHPHIVRVHEFAVEQGTPFLVMDYAPHGNLRALHSPGSCLSLQSTVAYIKQVVAALQYAHNHQLIHRDVKPENMLLGPHDEVLLSDFGISLLSPSPEQLSTQEMAGTLAYMAPEQIRGKPVFASDQYSLAVVVYEWLCGSRPFTGGFGRLVEQQLYEDPPSLQEKNAAIPEAVEAVVLRALAKDPRERYVSVQSFASALAGASQERLLDQDDGPERMLPRRDSPGLLLAANASATLPADPPPVAHRRSRPDLPSPSSQKRRPGRRSHMLIGATLGLILLLLVVPMITIRSILPTLGRSLPTAASTRTPTTEIVTATGGAEWSTLTVAERVVYVGPAHNKVYAIDARTGQQKWAFPTGDEVRSSPTVVDGVLYVGSGDRKVYAIDAHTGQQKWAFPTGAYIHLSPTIANGVVYVGADDGTVYAIDARTGQQKWAFPTGSSDYGLVSSPIVANGVVYVGSGDNKVYAIDARTGQQKWSFFMGWSGAISPPMVVNGVLYIGSIDGRVYAIDVQTGQQKWAFPINDGVYAALTVVNGVVYVISIPGIVYAIDTKTGQQKWTFPTRNATGSWVQPPPIVVNGVVYVSSDDKNVYAIDAQTGQQKWAVPTDSQGRFAPVVVNGILYITGTDDGRVYAINTTTGQQKWTFST